MNDIKELVAIARSYGTRIQKVGTDRIRLHNPEALPDTVKELLKTHKTDLLKYLEESYLDMALRRSLDGYDWLLERKQQYYRTNHIPVSDVRIEVQEWRQCIADVINLNPCEVHTIENILINRGELVYYGNNQCVMSRSEASQVDICLLDDRYGFNNWYITGRQFVVY